MKKLSLTALNQINNYMNNNARPLEQALFNYYFNNLKSDIVLNELEIFQNTDGGFGKGIEPDFKLMKSSSMATSIGLRHLSRMDDTNRAQKMIAKAISYLEDNFDYNRKGWFSVPKEVNSYPHAPWWEYKDGINMTVIDYFWGNPTAELIGYFYKYKKYVNKLDVFSLIEYAIDNLNKKVEFNSEHEIFCYIHLYNRLEEKYSIRLQHVLQLAISKLINVNESEWTNYVPTPLKFIEMESKNFFEIEKELIDKNLDYIISNLEERGKILPTWSWGSYLEDWEIAKNEWTGILTLESLVSLKKFNRI